MQRFKSILFSPLGDSDNAPAVRRVVGLAHENKAHLTLYGVIHEPSTLQRVLHRPEFSSELQEAEIQAMTKRLGRWAANNRDGQIDVVIATGSQALQIIDRVINEGHDLVVVTTDEDKHDQATIRRLLRKCPCPVWVIRPSRARTLRVLAAVNPDPDEIDLNRNILELASSMVDRFGGELHLVHAWELYGESTMRSSAFLHTPPAELETPVERGRSR
jgi:universal stress protein E